uniref:JmjC domain-containing protein n=1 Tax=Rhabditophanes sp. KR3021 TaxID=114890 RepID=A0AC35U8P8_9BILA
MIVSVLMMDTAQSQSQSIEADDVGSLPIAEDDVNCRNYNAENVGPLLGGNINCRDGGSVVAANDSSGVADVNGALKDLTKRAKYLNSFRLIGKVNVPLSISSDELFGKLPSKFNESTDYDAIYELNVPFKWFDCPEALLTREELNEDVVSVDVSNMFEDEIKQISNIIYNEPITVVKGLATSCGFNLDLFDTKIIYKIKPDITCDTRTQFFKNVNVNVDKFCNETWYCQSVESKSSLRVYKKYQDSERKRTLEDTSSPPNKRGRKSDYEKWSGIEPPRKVKFATNIDLSKEIDFPEQYKELKKLPSIFQIQSTCNALNYTDQTILGMNTVQLYMKVRGVKTPCHQENNNFASVNINAGPEDCEWFAVAYEYVPKFLEICKQKNINFLKKTFWPIADELRLENIPVIRFVQKPGDLVFVNTGCIHWVQGLGVCNNVSWNVGPMNAYQIRGARYSFDYNMSNNYRNLIPLQHICWRIAQENKVSDGAFYAEIKNILIKNLAYMKMTLNHLEAIGVNVLLQKRKKSEISKFCFKCPDEVYNIMFVTRENIKQDYKCYCYNCMNLMLDTNKQLDFYVVMAAEIKEYIDIFDAFKLNTPISSEVTLSN